MSIQHDNLPVDPRLESLLRQVVAASDLAPDRNQRVRDRLGLSSQPTVSLVSPSLTLPVARAATLPRSTAGEKESAMNVTSRHHPRQQWFQFALAGVAFIAVGVLLALVFGSGGDDPEAQPGTAASPEATESATVSTTGLTASSAQAVRDALEPLPPGQERRMVLEVEAHNQHDNAFDRWTIELWQRWSETGVLSEGLYVSDPAGDVVTHIALNGQQLLLNWEPRDGVFDTPLEYSLQRRVLGAALAAVNDPDAYALRSEERDGLVVLQFEWRDNYAEEFGYISRGEAWIEPETGRLLRIVHFVDRPEQEPYPTRTFVVRDMQILPAESSPAGAYEIAGATAPKDVLLMPTRTGEIE